MLLSSEALLKAPVIWLPLLLAMLLSVSPSMLASVSVWLVLPETISAVLLSVDALVKEPVIWLPLLLEEEMIGVVLDAAAAQRLIGRSPRRSERCCCPARSC